MEEKVNLDLLCYNFNKELIDLINRYGEQLPSSIVYILMKDVLRQVEFEKDKVISDLLMQQRPEPIEKTVIIPVTEKTE